MQQILDAMRHPLPEEFKPPQQIGPDVFGASASIESIFKTLSYKKSYYYIHRDVAKVHSRYHMVVKTLDTEMPACSRSDKYILATGKCLSFSWFGFRLWLIDMI